MQMISSFSKLNYICIEYRRIRDKNLTYIHCQITFFISYFTDKNLPSGFPRIKQNPKMKVVEKGRNAILVCEAEGDPPVNIYWVKDSIRLRRDPRFTVMQQGKLRGERVQNFCVVFRHILMLYILVPLHSHTLFHTKTQNILLI